jgi:hypothetical protein
MYHKKKKLNKIKNTPINIKEFTFMYGDIYISAKVCEGK